MATETINQTIRKGLRVSSSKYSDDEIKVWITRALAFLNLKTGRTDTIADEDNATTTDIVYDAMLAKYALWQIHVELYKETTAVGPQTGDGVFQHISTVYRREFFDFFASCYPGLVKFEGGKYIFTDQAAAVDPFVGVTDGRYNTTRFDTPDNS